MAQGALRRRVRPSASNRDAAIEALWAEVADGIAHIPKLPLPMHIALAEEFFGERNIGSIGINCFQRSYVAMTMAVGALWRRDAEGPERLKEAFALLYWGAEIQQHWWLRERIPYDREPKVLDRFWLHGLAAAGGAPEIANWVAPHQLNVFRATGGVGGIILSLDPPFGRFFKTLMEAQVRGRWPDRIDRIAMRGYGNLLARVNDPQAFSAALVECCDYRVMQALGYDSMDAPAPRPESRTGSVLDGSNWPKLYPLELFSLRHIYQATTGKLLSLEAEHPLLKTPLMNVPPLLPLYEDEFIRRARVLAQEVFGSAWKPMTRVPLI